jgi:hypothetical protein
MKTLNLVRKNLLELHKSLLDAERREIERLRGRLSDAEFLRAVIQDPALAWLQPLTALLARTDATLDGEEGADPPAALIGQLRVLLAGNANGEFQRRYAEVLENSPDAVIAHVKTVRALAHPEKVL